MHQETQSFGEVDGQPVQLFTIRNSNGVELQVTDFGAIVVSVKTPDRNGDFANINLGFDNLAGYRQRHPYFGSTVGRYGNRIARAVFSLDGQAYQLAANNPPNHLHGGDIGFDRFVWNADLFTGPDELGVQFRRTSVDGEEGFPGNLEVSVIYSLTENNELVIRYEATTDQPTVLNLTNHNYWNLAGVGSGKVLDHQLEMPAAEYVPVDETLIPTGELRSVSDTPLDFRTRQPFGDRIEQVGGDPLGYDHCFVVPGANGELRPAASVVEPKSGRRMDVETTEPGIQLYTANFLDGTPADGGFGQHEAFCLETQHFPDSPNQPAFPSTRLDPGSVFQSTTRHRFSR